VEDEFGKGLSPPSHGWSSLLRTLELAIAAGPLILFDGKKLSTNKLARSRLTIVSGGPQIHCFSYDVISCGWNEEMLQITQSGQWKK
jgi:hypothetical protein